MTGQGLTPAKSKTKPDKAAQEEQIRRRAYEIYLARGGQGASELDDWLQAEAELEVGAHGNPAVSSELCKQPLVRVHV